VDELMERGLDFLFGLSTTTVYLLIGVLCWAEAAFFLGFVTPGEIAVATGGVLASRGPVAVEWLIVAATVGTVAGNTTGYWLGRTWGSRLLDWGPIQRVLGGAIGKSTAFLERRGEWAIVLSRLTTVTRVTVPFMVGASGVRYRRFLVFDVPSAAAWAAVWVMLGFVLGESWMMLMDRAGEAAFLVLILAAAALVIRWVAVRVAANQRRIRAAGRLLLAVTGLRALARRLTPVVQWIGRRFDPRLAQGLNLTLGFVVLVAAVGGIGLVLSQTRAVWGLALIDFPVLEWMGATRTDEAVRIARTGLQAFHWPGFLVLALPVVAVLAWRVGGWAAFLTALGMVGAGLGAYGLDRFVLEGVVPRAEFPSVPVSVAAALLVHLTVATGQRAGWGPGVTAAAVMTFVVFAVALGTVVAGWAAPSGIALGLALGMAWATTLELQPIIFRGGDPAGSREDTAPA